MEQQLLSVGIDIGTSTTQLVFSLLTIQNTASAFSVPRMVITGKEIVYASDIYFTPLLSDTVINSDEIRRIIDREYEKAGIKKESIQTGAVIITGETARKENASEVLYALSGYAGDFVVATAGPDLEGIIAAKGAGAAAFSDEKKASVLNFDIGGGTSNLALFKSGEPVATGCLDIGGRLIKVGPDRKITYITQKVQTLAGQMGIPLHVGDEATEQKLSPIIDVMVSVLAQSAHLSPKTKEFDLFITNKCDMPEKIDYVTFSGGVAEVIYNDFSSKDPFLFGDIGVLLGRAIKKSPLATKIPLLRANETIRATVVGAGSHTTEISGSTITWKNVELPLKNIPILKLSPTDEEAISQTVAGRLSWFDTDLIALGLRGPQSPTFTQVERYAEEIVRGLSPLMEKGLPLLVVCENDFAKVLGQAMLSYYPKILCIDNIKVENGDYIDIGVPVPGAGVIPVVIKTLVLASPARGET